MKKMSEQEVKLSKVVYESSYIFSLWFTMVIHKV